MDILPTEVLLDFLLFCPLLSIIGNISLTSRRFALISNLILFPTKKADDEKRIERKRHKSVKVELMMNNTRRKRRWHSSNSSDENADGAKEVEVDEQQKEEPRIVVSMKFGDLELGTIPLPECAPPPEWKLGIGKFDFDGPDDNYGKFPELVNFVKFLLQSGEINASLDEMPCCSSYTRFRSGFASLFRGHVVQFEVGDIGEDDHTYDFYSHENPFTFGFFKEVPQLILYNWDNANGALGMSFNRRHIIRWLCRPLPNSSKYYNCIGRKLKIYSTKVDDLPIFIDEVISEFRHSPQPCLFDIWITCNDVRATNLAHYLSKTNPRINKITGEALKITQLINDPGDKKQRVHIRRCPVEQIDQEPMCYEESCNLFI